MPEAVGKDAAHFDLSVARKLASDRESSGDWLVLQLQELISLAYQVKKGINFGKPPPPVIYSENCSKGILTR